MTDQPDDEAVEASSSDRRVWKRADPSKGSSLLTLKVFGILYDAGEPLTREQIAERLIPQLSATTTGYLKAWYVRRLEQQVQWQAKSRGDVSLVERSTRLTPEWTITDAIKRWVLEVFAQRLQKKKGSLGRTLVRDADGRYSPGPSAPRIMTLDGQLLSYTPAVRRELEHADRERGRTHLALVEWDQLLKRPEFATAAARAHLVMFLMRRLLLEDGKWPLDERKVQGQFGHLLQLADTPAIRRDVIQQAITDFLKTLG